MQDAADRSDALLYWEMRDRLLAEALAGATVSALVNSNVAYGSALPRQTLLAACATVAAICSKTSGDTFGSVVVDSDAAAASPWGL